MVLSIFIALGFIIYLAIGMIRQISETKLLTEELKKYGSKKLLITLDRNKISENESYFIFEAKERDLFDSKSITRRLMRKCGRQKLPCIFWLTEDGKIKSEKLNEANIN